MKCEKVLLSGTDTDVLHQGFPITSEIRPWMGALPSFPPQVGLDCSDFSSESQRS